MKSVEAPGEVAYKLVAHELRTAILQRRYGTGIRLPTEAELAAEYRVSRHTVRRAFQDLVAEGLVHRVPGLGTFPATRSEDYIRQLGAIEDLMGLGPDTRIEVLCPLRRQVHIDAASRLRLDGDAVHTVVLRALRNGEPFCHAVQYLHPTAAAILAEFPDLEEELTASDATIVGLLDTRLPAPIAEAEQSITAAPADGALAHALGCEPGTSLLRIDRMYLTTERQPVQLAISHFLPAQYSYRVKLRRGHG
jgi:DNA-binding GntR family transcriptional regulator